MIDAVYAVLARVQVGADLTLESPSGGQVRLTNGPENDLRLNCDRAETLWDCFDLGRQLGVLAGFRSLRRLRSPFLQPITVSVADREVFRWSPERLPKILSLRGAIAFLKAR